MYDLTLAPSYSIKMQTTMLERFLTYDLDCYRAAVYMSLKLRNMQSSSNKLEADCPELYCSVIYLLFKS